MWRQCAIFMQDENTRLDDYGDGSEPQSSRAKFYAWFLLIMIIVMGAYLVFRWHEARQREHRVETSVSRLK